MCYMEPNCVSINFGPLHGGKYTCQLNSATDEDHLEETPNFTFLAIEVNIFMAQLFFNASVMFSHCSYIRCVIQILLLTRLCLLSSTSLCTSSPSF